MRHQAQTGLTGFSERFHQRQTGHKKVYWQLAHSRSAVFIPGPWDGVAGKKSGDNSVAFGAVLLFEVSNLNEANERLSALLPSVTLDPEGVSDLLFRINRRRRLSSGGGAWLIELARGLLSRVAQWGLRYQRMVHRSLFIRGAFCLQIGVGHEHCEHVRDSFGRRRGCQGVL